MCAMPLEAGLSLERAADALYFVEGVDIFQLEIWSDEEWSSLTPESRPSMVEHIPGLGWVGGIYAGAADGEELEPEYLSQP